MGDDVSLATRVLCCIMGSIRGGPLAWQSLELRVLRPLNADLAVLGVLARPSQAPLDKLARYVACAGAIGLGHAGHRADGQ